MKVQWLTGALVLAAAPVFAQPPMIVAVPPSGLEPQAQARFQMRVMEGVLESAVQHGAQALGAQLQRVSPDVTLFSGPARARGFRLEGYGAFFSVDVPALHRSLTWSVRTLAQANGDVSRALQAIRRMVHAQNDARMKSELEQALRLVELQVGPPPAALPDPQMASTRVVAAADAGAVAARPASPDRDGIVAPALADPDAAYTTAVQDAIVDAMLDYGQSLNLAPGEWLTVAARENRESLFAGDLTDSVTITLRVKGAELEAFRMGRTTREEMRRRVEVQEF